MRLQDESSVNRLGIFFFYDAEGVVDDYVTTLLDGFKPHFSEMTIVCNGKLNAEGKAKLSPYTNNLIVRPNKGFDVWAYKTAMESHGWENLAHFDEVVLFNATIMGPVYPFSEMFEAMDQRDLDFWGITKFHKVPQDPFGRSPFGYLPEHIQSHFHAYRRSLITSKAFQDYWDNMPPSKATTIPSACTNRCSPNVSPIRASSGTSTSTPTIWRTSHTALSRSPRRR